MADKITKAHSSYLAVIAAVCLVVPAAALWLTTTTWYYTHSSGFWDKEQELQFNVRDQRADVLFIGDSSAVYGVLPDAISRATGLGIRNLGVTMPALALTGDHLVERYLAHNKTPRLMVLYVGPELRSRPPFAESNLWYVGEIELMRYGRPGEVVDFFERNPDEITMFAGLSIRRLLASNWTQKQYNEMARELNDAAGYVPQPLPTSLGAKPCPLSKVATMPDTQFIQDFRRLAADRGIAAAVYLAPIPDCDSTFAATATSYAAIVDNVPYTMPHQLFAEDVQRIHMRPEGAQQNAVRVAEFLNRWMTTAHLAKTPAARVSAAPISASGGS